LGEGPERNEMPIPMPPNILMKQSEFDSLSPEAKKAFASLFSENHRLKAEQARRNMVDAANRAQSIRDKPLLQPNDWVGSGKTEAHEHFAFLSDWILKNAALDKWESAIAASGRCPKCSDNLAAISDCSEMRFMRCMGCDCIFVVPPNPNITG
jgi:hypothetical protein